MMEQLRNWCSENCIGLTVVDEESRLLNTAIGLMLYVGGEDGKVIDDDFKFILTDDELDALEDNKDVRYILFQFGRQFYYANLKKEKDRYNEEAYVPEFNDFRYIGKSVDADFIPFAHLGVHSEYDLLNGSGNAELWVRKAEFLNCRALGICDTNTLSGTLPFQTVCEKHGLKSIIGETVSVAPRYDSTLDIQETFELKLYVFNGRGWRNLLLINKFINVDHKQFVTEEELLTHAEGLVCVIGKESEFNFHSDDIKYCRRLMDKYNAVFEDVYYQIDTVEYDSQQLFKKHLQNIDNYICNWSKRLKPILVNDSYYLDADESNLRTMLNKIAGKVLPSGKNQFFKSSKQTVESYGEWLDNDRLLETILIAVENTVKLSDRIDFKIPTGERKLPAYDCKEGAEELFFREVQKGFNKHFKTLSGKKKEEYLKRLETECNVIVPNGLCDYFMILWDIINWCHKNGISTGPGRGSVCGSLIAYCLGITNVDPIPYGLMFERFLNETRVSGERAKSSDSMPDIDVDFPAEYRDVVKGYISARFGELHTCSIATYTRMKLKTCIKDFGKLKGLSFDYTNKLTKDIDDQIEYTWGDLIKYATQSKTLFKFVQENPDIVHLTKYALLQPRAESIHPSAVVIVPKTDSRGNKIDIYGWMPVKEIDGMLVSEWEGKYIDKSGFLKEDILGLNQLDKFDSILRLIRQNTKKTLDLNDVTFDDDDVYKFFQQGWNEDIFQFGTNGLMNYCRQVKPKTLDDLIAMTALFRPGPMDIGAHQDFADIKRGKKKPTYDYGMEQITHNTFSLYVYQEQIMKAVVVGGLTPVESDVLRTTIKKKDVKTLASFGDKFKQGYGQLLKEHGIDDYKEYAARVWDKLLAFSGYGFNKSHAAAYTILSYWSQWLKVNYPLEFWTTSLQYASESEIPYRLSEMKKCGAEIEIRPPDINYSDGGFTCDAKEQRIFFSLAKIKGCGDVAVQNILETRNKGGKFFSFDEFCSRVPSKVNKTVIKSLIIAGAFDLLESIKNQRDRRQLLQRFLETKGDKLPEQYETNEAKTNAFWITEQKRLTGFGEIDYESMVRDMIPSRRVAEHYVSDQDFLITTLNSEVTVVGKCIFTGTKELKKGGVMCNLKLDCNNMVIPITFWDDAYQKLPCDVDLLKNKLIAVSGVVKKDKFTNERRVYSNTSSRVYLLQK
jgi:DNA polymerase-3 subunit alpha